jgi:hypothetical protein
VKIEIVEFWNPAPRRGETRDSGRPVWQVKISKNIYNNSHLLACVNNDLVKSVYYGTEDGNKKFTTEFKKQSLDPDPAWSQMNHPIQF